MAKIDTTAPVTADNVPAATQPGPIVVTLAAADSAGSGVTATWYTTDGSDPANAANPARRRYDPAARLTLHNGQRITYYSVDAVGNAERVRASRTASVTAPTPKPAPRPAVRRPPLSAPSPRPCGPPPWFARRPPGSAGSR